MNTLTFEETNLLCIYNPGTRQGAIEALTEMCSHLQADETELLALTDSTLAKLRAMTDAEFDKMMADGLAQAKADDSFDIDEVFSEFVSGSEG